jgi:RNA polymerase sigma-70 factor (ECF subfamily)
MVDHESSDSNEQAAVDTTSPSLLGRAKAGERDAWTRLVDLYAPLLYEWCRRSGLQADDAADVVQDIFATVARRLVGFHRDRPGDSFRAWLRTIARNKINDHFRRLKGEAKAQGGTDAQLFLADIPGPPADISTCPLPDDSNNLERRAVALVGAGVEERTWQAFWRVTVEGEKVAEVAESLGISTQAVYDAKYRIRRKVRQELEGLME